MSRKTEVLAEKFMALRKAGVPMWVTSGEAFRMTSGAVGADGDMNGSNGFQLAALVLAADKVGATVEPL